MLDSKQEVGRRGSSRCQTLWVKRPLPSFEAVREALEGHADSKWRAWRAKQGLDARVPEALADVLGLIQSWADDLVGAEFPLTR